MDSLRELRSALVMTRISSGDALLALDAMTKEIEMNQRVLSKLLLVAPELVEAAALEVQLEDEEK